MTTPVNLNRFRKAAARAGAKATAAENRVAFGRTKGEKALAETVRQKAARGLDGSKREP
ncbi:MAG: DUF4169 family protein [Caulobacter sp.]|nr:DUF4169 family protein [Caulobacter sp.]